MADSCCLINTTRVLMVASMERCVFVRRAVVLVSFYFLWASKGIACITADTPVRTNNYSAYYFYSCHQPTVPSAKTRAQCLQVLCHFTPAYYFHRSYFDLSVVSAGESLSPTFLSFNRAIRAISITMVATCRICYSRHTS